MIRPLDFFRTHPVFRFEEFVSEHTAGGRSANSSKATLQQHLAAGNLVNVRRRVYAVVPPGMRAESLVVDPFLLCSRLAPRAVIAYHAALRLHGRAHSESRRYTYLGSGAKRSFSFRGDEFVPVRLPSSLRELADLGGEMLQVNRHGLSVRVTSLERTLVDLMAAPQHGGGWEEIWRSLESVEFFDLDAVVTYLGKLGSAIAAARVGLFLEQHRNALMVEAQHLDALQQLGPRQPRYFDRRLGVGGELARRWNLIVPKRIATRSWEEPG